jgi:uncharacterized protein (TIGR03083 family)
VTDAERLRQLAVQGDALVGLASGPELEQPVPSCPGWSVAEVVRHVGGAHRWCISVLDGGETPSTRPVGEPEVDQAALAPWLQDGLEELLGRLRTTLPDAPTWTPVPAGRVGWWTRKMVVETALHRWDAESALAGSKRTMVDPVPTPVAADGIDEYVDDFVVGLAARTPGERPSGRVGLAATEGPMRWSVDLGSAPVSSGPVSSGRPTETTQVTGSASDLLLWLWNRLPRPLESLMVTGDPSVVEGWHTLKI